MATAPFSTLHLSNQLFLSPPPHKSHAPSHSSFATRATPDDSSDPNTNTNTADSTEPSTDSDNFENRLSKIQLRYRIGAGKKAEVRKSRKSSKKSGSSGATMYLPPVPLKEPISGGLKVEFGFSPYSERVNGRVALLGVAALLLVELATGKSVIKYHSPAIVFVQMYFVAAATAMYSKFEKERVSVWPRIPSPSDK